MIHDSDAKHLPVLLKEAVDGLEIRKGDVFFDGTLGLGGHSKEVCKKFGREVKIVGVDMDGSALERARQSLKGCDAHLEEGNFRNLDKVLSRIGIEKVDRILFDLGINSTQLDDSGRGFSLNRTEPLLMTFVERPGKTETTAKEVVNEWSEESIKEILAGFSDEKYADKIADAIVDAREGKQIETTTELVGIIKSATPGRYHRGKTHFATKTFQALRMAVNDEMGALEEGLSKGLGRLSKGGRMAVISFHSVEDRAVKIFFRNTKKSGLGEVVTKKPIVPSKEEIEKNKRARSAKLRIFEKF